MSTKHLLAASAAFLGLAGACLATAGTSQAADPTLRVRAGAAGMTDSAGVYWGPDQYAVGGQLATTTKTVSGTTSPERYRSERVGMSAYRIPVGDPGVFRVSLHQAETRWWKRGQRVFDVYAENVLKADDVDIAKRVGADRADTIRFDVTVTDGTLDLDFRPLRDLPKLNAYDVTRVSTLAAPTTTSPAPTSSPTATTTTAPTVSPTATATATATTSPAPSPVATTSSTTLWATDHEEGSLAAWSRDGNGGEYNTSPGDTVISRDRARTGSYSAKLIHGGGHSGTRMFRWGETNAHRTVTVEQWMYFPTAPTVTNWWWLQEFKTTRESDGRNQASWIVDAYNPSPGVLRGRLSWVLNQYDKTTEGPHAGEFGNKNYPASVDFPIGRWFKSTITIKQSKDFDGEISWSIDDKLQTRQTGIRTAWPSTKRGNAWQTDVGYASISYGENVTPSPYAYYVDDVRISR